MTTNGIVWAIVAWLALQVPIGMVVGHYMRDARASAANPVRRKRQNETRRRTFATRPPALLRG